MLIGRRRSFPFSVPILSLRFGLVDGGPRTHRILATLFAISLAAAGTARAQSGNAHAISAAAEVRALPHHVPSWANQRNLIEAVPGEQTIGPLTLVLARRPDREQAFEKLLADQQNPSSPDYHRWLTPSEIGERFGRSTQELDTLTNWLESQGLHVDLVSPARNLIAFSGPAGDVGRAFQTDVNFYTVNGKRKMSVASAPMLPADLAPMVKAIRGLYTIEDRPFSAARAAQSNSPEATFAVGENFVTPADFATIYDLPSDLTGKGVTIGIVGRSRTDPADFEYFRNLTGTTFADPTEVIPTGGTDPGPAYTSPPPSGTSIGDQLEAELDVARSASIAQQAKVLLVVTAITATADIGTDATYLINTQPFVQVINISFGACESEVGPSGVTYWDGLFSQAAMEGISVFVASGDAGASGCDTYFSTPPSDPSPNSPNYICSSSYATCLGGTEFNDASDYDKYWTTSNSADLGSALSYIPEGAWNEPLNGNSQPQAAASGGGVSSVIPTPGWQTGTGVPTARAGRYTPDLAFSASGHDGYFGCMAALAATSTQSAGCVPNAQGEYYFAYFEGTSAAAPDMAGITALLDQKLGKGQGNLNLVLYPLAARAPSVFHDVTVATSGVDSCTVNTPSMCNNSIPGPSGLTGGQAGYAVGAGYDEVTGLGSLDVGKFIDQLGAPGKPPAATTASATAVKSVSATLSGTVNPEGSATQYWFLYGTSSTLSGAAKTAAQTAGSGTTGVAVTAKLTGLTAARKYYYRLQASNANGTASGAIDSFTTSPRARQTIDFTAPPSSLLYGGKVILSAKASSGLPVAFKVLEGSAELSGSTLIVTGLGSVEVAAEQAGNAAYLAAPSVTYTIAVKKAVLTVKADNEGMTEGSKVPALGYTITGFVDNDTRAKSTQGNPSLSTLATSSSPPGPYTVTVKVGNLSAGKYIFKTVNGTLTVKP